MAFTPNNPSNGQKKNPFRFSLWWMYAIVFVFLAGVFYFDTNTVSRKVSYTDFERYVEQDHGINKIVVFTDKKIAEGYLTDSLAEHVFANSNYRPGSGVEAKVETTISSADKMSDKIDEWRNSGAFTGKVEYEQSSPLTSILISVLPFVLFIGIWIFLMRRMSGAAGGGGAGGGGNSDD